MEGERLAGLLHQRVELHVAVVMHRLVARRADGETDDALKASIFLHLLDAGLRRVERQIDKALETVVLGQNALDQPLVISLAQRRLDVVLRMHAKR